MQRAMRNYQQWEFDMEVLRWYNQNRGEKNRNGNRVSWAAVGRQFHLSSHQAKATIKRAAEYANLEATARWSKDWTLVDEYYERTYR